MTANQTIDRVPGLRALLAETYNHHGTTTNHRDRLCALLMETQAAQPQAEPVARHPDAIIEGVMTSVGISHAIYASTVTLKHGEQVKLYAEQPAPVAVVLPERLAMTGRGLMDAPTVNHHLGWNACLDELKRLNPSL